MLSKVELANRRWKPYQPSHIIKKLERNVFALTTIID